jgi:hypothetical protein
MKKVISISLISLSLNAFGQSAYIHEPAGVEKTPFSRSIEQPRCNRYHLENDGYIVPEIILSSKEFPLDFLYETDLWLEHWLGDPVGGHATEEEIIMESWMTVPFLSDEPLSVEEWMRTPFMQSK